MKTVTKLWIGLCILALLSPLGLILPEHFKAGDAWGEWGTDAIKDLIGYVPAGLEKISSLWRAPLPDYAFKGHEAANISHLSVEYVVSAFTGIALCVGAAFILGKMLTKKKMKNE